MRIMHRAGLDDDVERFQEPALSAGSSSVRVRNTNSAAAMQAVLGTLKLLLIG
ncbi:MAG: hypothetical protein ACI8WM_000923 [Burkholderiaceae bacterium]|jgi:hypothetical protein